jgi:hypothetical protein
LDIFTKVGGAQVGVLEIYLTGNDAKAQTMYQNIRLRQAQ